MAWKRAIIICIILCSVVNAANDINAFAPGISTAYSVVRERDGDVWYVSGQVFEVWGTGARTAADYDIALTDKTGGMFVGNMDTNIGAGQYHIVTHYQAAGAPADTDPAVWQEYGTWDGDEWFSGILGDVNDLIADMNDLSVTDVNTAVWTSLVADFTDELTFGGEVGGLDPNITLILEDTGTTIPATLALIKYKTDLISLVDTVVKDSNDANNFTIEDGTDVNDAYWFMAIQVEDADDNLSKEIRWINFYDENSGDPNIWVDEQFSFTPAVGDVVHVMGTTYGGYLFRILNDLRQTKGVLNVIDKTRSGTGGLDRAGAIRIDALGDDP